VIRTIFSGFIVIATAACTVSSVEPLAVPLTYIADPQPDAARRTFSCPSVARIQVDDKRAEKTLGVRAYTSKPLKADVTAANDPALWAREGMQNFMARNGIKIAPDGPQLIVGLDTLRTSESMRRRSDYEARIVLAAELQSPRGRTCWEESAEGKGANFGYSGNIEDYQEMLNGALDAATLHILDSDGFKNALCHCAD
jgi:hypothetical protein